MRPQTIQEVFPRGELERRFGKPLSTVQQGMESIPALNRADLFVGSLALNVWNRIVETEKMKVDPYAISAHISQGVSKPSLLGAIGQIIGQPVIKDLSLTVCRAVDRKKKNPQIAKLAIAHVFPNDFHIADVYYQDKYRPLPERLQRYQFVDYYGFGLMDITMERIQAYARKLGCNNLTLTCAARDLVGLFKRDGFRKETGKLGSQANAMEKPLSSQDSPAATPPPTTGPAS
ncbi:MAG: hypothetical protein JWO38_4019 [Gemmataceae bacterium]|nr:hypothetical protein [Gemmataceae bacterium]